MADKQRRLPQWYLDKVNMATEVYRGAPDKVEIGRPHVDAKPNCGIGVTAQRASGMASTHPNLGWVPRLTGKQPSPTQPIRLPRLTGQGRGRYD